MGVMNKLLINKLRDLVVAIVSVGAIFLAIHITAAGDGKRKTSEFINGREVVAGEVIVKFHERVLPGSIDKAKKNSEVDSDKHVGGKGARLLHSRSKNTATLIAELSTNPDVIYVEPNYIIRTVATTNDPNFKEQWGLQNTGFTNGVGAGTANADIGAVSAWDISKGSKANVVAVVDTGIQATHPDLAANMWTATAAFTVNIGGQFIRCEAGTHGFDAIAKTCTPTDDYGHGTHVAGIIGAAGNNGTGGVGLNWTASIMDIKFIDSTGSGTISDALDAIEFAIQVRQALGSAANVRVLNNSWGWNGDASLALQDQIIRAAESDMLFVAGAGNGGADYASDNNDISPFYPASYDLPSVVSVAATDNNDALGHFSNFGANSVDLGAPGVLIYSTVKEGSYDYWSGTSMATPHVAGAAALVLSRCTLDTANLKASLLNNVDPVPSLAGITITGGRLNVNKAMRSCADLTQADNSWPSVQLTNPPEGYYAVPQSFNLIADVTDSDGSVTKVDFYSGSELVGTASQAPFSINWDAMAVGEYMLKAVATDNSGAVTTSSPVKVIVNETIIPDESPTPTPVPAPNRPPNVVLTTPSTGSTYNYPASFTISADAIDSDGGTITKVDFYANSTWIGSSGAASSPFAITWSNPSSGKYSLTAVATDDAGASTTSPGVNVNINSVPVANAGGSYSGAPGQAIQFNGTGSSDPDGTIWHYNWTFGDGTNASGATPTHVYNSVGTYTVRLTVADNYGAKSSATTTATIRSPLPDAPSGLVASSPRNSEVGLRWTDNSANEQNFEVYRSTSSSSGFVQVATLGANTTAYTDRQVQKKTTYYYRVRALNGAGPSAYSNTANIRTK
jgi:serine protease